jgi:hypothetical protein
MAIGKNASMIGPVRSIDEISAKIINNGIIQEDPILCCSDNDPFICRSDDNSMS